MLRNIATRTKPLCTSAVTGRQLRSHTPLEARTEIAHTTSGKNPSVKFRLGRNASVSADQIQISCTDTVLSARSCGAWTAIPRSCWQTAISSECLYQHSVLPTFPVSNTCVLVQTDVQILSTLLSFVLNSKSITHKQDTANEEDTVVRNILLTMLRFPSSDCWGTRSSGLLRRVVG